MLKFRDYFIDDEPHILDSEHVLHVDIDGVLCKIISIRNLLTFINSHWIDLSLSNSHFNFSLNFHESSSEKVKHAARAVYQQSVKN